MDWSVLNHIRAPCFQGSNKSPDKQVVLSHKNKFLQQTQHHKMITARAVDLFNMQWNVKDDDETVWMDV